MSGLRSAKSAIAESPFRSVTTVLLAVVVAALVLPGESPVFSQAVGQSSMITGRVVDGNDRTPISDAEVTLVVAPIAEQTVAVEVPTTTTDTSGRFFFVNVPAGTLHIKVKRAGYLDGSFGQTHPGGGDKPLPLPVIPPVPLDVMMWEPAVLTGTVVDEMGDPVVGTTVDIFGATYLAGRSKLIRRLTAMTDDRGVFRASTLEPGAYAACVRAIPFSFPSDVYDDLLTGGASTDRRLLQQLNSLRLESPATLSTWAVQRVEGTASWAGGPSAAPASDGSASMYPTTCAPAAPSMSGATMLMLKSGLINPEAEIQIRPTKAVKVSGTLTTPDGPANHVAIRLVAINTFGGVDRSDDDVARGLTDAHGGFTFFGVAPGQYAIRATETPAQAYKARMPSMRWAAEDVQVGDTDVTNLSVSMREGLRVSGQVVFQGADPASSAQLLKAVTLVPESADGSVRAITPVSPAADGTFQLSGVEPGRYFVRVRSMPDKWALERAQLTAIDASDEAIDLSDRDVDGVVVTFTNTPSELTGAVVRQAGGGDAGAMVAVFPVKRSYWIDFGVVPRRLKMVGVDKDGNFRVVGLPSGNYYVAAFPEASAGDWRDIGEMFDVLSRAAQQVEIRSGQQQRVTLTTIVR
jgi:protocatechuate 3,4-dioxygenase beta subunit